MKLLTAMCSISLQQTHVKEIGRDEDDGVVVSFLLCWVNRDGKAIETVNRCGNTELSKVSTRWRLCVGAKVNRQLFYRSAEYKMTKSVQKTQRSAFTYWCA